MALQLWSVLHVTQSALLLGENLVHGLIHILFHTFAALFSRCLPKSPLGSLFDQCTNTYKNQLSHPLTTQYFFIIDF